MREGLRAAVAAARVEAQLLDRSRALVGLVVLVAVTFLVLVSLFGLTGSRAPTALVDHDHSALSREFTRELRAAHHSFALRPMTEEQARRSVARGEIVAVITIPRGFGKTITAGRTVQLPVTVDNVNADLTDDIREAVPSAIFALGRDLNLPRIRLAPAERDLIDHDTGYIPYLVVSALVLTTFVVGGILGATAITREYEGRTIAQWRLAPVHAGWVLAGKLASSALISAAAVAVTAAIVVFGYGVHPTHPAAAAAVLLLCVVLFTCLGACVGAFVRRTLPVAALFFGLALPLYIDSGALEPLRFDGERLWYAGHATPAYSAIGIVEWAFHGFSVTPESLGTNALVLVAWLGAAAALTTVVLGRRVVRQ
jgi:ABC-type Na+ efflux pump permease subunit